MKKYIFALMAVMLPVLTMLAQEQQQTPAPTPEQKIAELSFEREMHDFGTLVYKSKPVTTEFAFTNTGTAPLVITRSEVSCTCLSVKFPKAPVAPGESGVVTVTYSPKNEIGTFSNNIKLYSNASDRRTTIFVQGEVVKK